MTFTNVDLTNVRCQTVIIGPVSSLDSLPKLRITYPLTHVQVSWYWNYLTEENVIWKRKCLRRGWFLPEPPLLCDCKAWKRHYVDCVRQLHWKPPQVA